MADYTKQIENLTAVLKQYRKSTILFGNETKIVELEDLRYRVIWSQIHDFLAKKHTDAAEREIQRLVKEVYINDLPVCRAKIEKLSHYLDIAKRKNNENDMALYYKYLQKWFELDENFRYLVAFRSLEQFALLWEKDFNDRAKVYKYSLDPYNDGGYTGANKPFLFYFNRMVLKKDIKFISKQYPTGYGKTLGDSIAIAWVLGMDKENDVLKVLGNPALVMTTMKTIVGIMTKPFFGKVFPEYAKYFGENSEPMNMFSICRAKEGELTLADSSKPLNLKVISKDTSIDGIRVRFLFIDDICRSKDMANLKQHQTDINNFWNSWWKRNYNTDDFYIVAGGTAYSVNDILSSLIATYSKGKLIQTKEFKYAYTNPNGDCYFIKIPKIDTDFERSTYPQKFSYESAVEMRDRDYATFMAMEQQMPQNPETSPLAWDKILTYDELPTGLSDGAFALLDPARTGKNFVTLGIHRTKKEVDKYNREVERHYLVDCIFKLKVMQDVYDEICEKVQKHHIVKLFIENNTDTSLGNLLRQKLDENGITFCEIKEFYSTENKEDKLREVVYSSEGYFKNQMVYPCRQLFAPASDMGKFMLYLTAYDYNVKLDYDDSIDEECMYIKRFVRQKNEFTKPKIIYR